VVKRFGPGHIALHGDPAPPPPKGHKPPIFGPYLLWPNGTKVGLGPSDIVLDGDPAPPPQKGAKPPIFCPCLLWPNGCMDQDATWYEGSPRPRLRCVTWGPRSPSQKGHSPRAIFRPTSVVAKRSPVSATAEHLLTF